MRGGWARFGAVVLSATALAAVTLFLISSSSAASQLLTGDSTGSVEKATIEKGGSCSLGTYIKAMPCSKNGESPACCAGLKSVFNNGCPCVAIPGIVISHGGTANSLIHNLMRCEPTDETGTVAPVDYVAHKLGCTDRPEWCGDRIPNVDVRVDGFSKGRIQIAATATQWTFVFATPEERDAVGSTVCHALGWGRGEIDPKADVDGSKLVTKRMTCGPEAQASHRISVRARSRAARARRRGGRCIRARGTQHAARSVHRAERDARAVQLDALGGCVCRRDRGVPRPARTPRRPGQQGAASPRRRARRRQTPYRRASRPPAALPPALRACTRPAPCR
jgi:hypothetical protein